MIEDKLHGVMNNLDIIRSFKSKGFSVINYIYARECIIFYVSKDYAQKFNIEFDGNFLLEVKIKFDYLNYSKPWLYPTFKEISNIIPKKLCNHIYRSGDICYAPPNRPIYEKWEFIDFVNAVDSMINNFLSKEYIGIGDLTELEHGQAGLNQYKSLILHSPKKLY